MTYSSKKKMLLVHATSPVTYGKEQTFLYAPTIAAIVPSELKYILFAYNALPD